MRPEGQAERQPCVRHGGGRPAGREGQDFAAMRVREWEPAVHSLPVSFGVTGCDVSRVKGFVTS